MKYVSVVMIADHVGRQPAAVRRALKAAKVRVKRLPGSLGLRVSEKDVNKVICERWPDVGSIPVSLRSILANRVVMTEDNVRALRRTVADLEACEKAKMVEVLRTNAQYSALYALVAELHLT